MAIRGAGGEDLRMHRSRMTTCALFAVLAAFVAALLAAGPARAADDGNQFEFENGTQQMSYGANAMIILSKGTLHYDKDCAALKGEPENDLFVAVSDVYVVPHNSVHGGDQPLVDTAVDGQNTIVGGGLFLAEVVGFTGPAGTLGEGVYDLVFDSCQNGFYEPAHDTVFPGAITIHYPTDIPGDAAAGAAIATMKANAKVVGDLIVSSHNAFEKTMTALEWMEKVKECGSGNIYLCLLGEFLADQLQSGADSLFGSGGTNEALLHLYLSYGKREQAIANDPPDPDFRRPTVVAPVETVPVGTDSPTLRAAAALAQALRSEDVLAEALLHALERYQGAQRENDAGWALVHAREVRDLSRTIAALRPASRAGFARVRALLADTPEDRLDAFRSLSLQLAGGVTAEQRRDLRNLGASSADIEAMERETEGPPPGFLRSELVALLQAHEDALTSRIAADEQLAAGAAERVAGLEAQAGSGRFTRRRCPPRRPLSSTAPPRTARPACAGISTATDSSTTSPARVRR